MVRTVAQSPLSHRCDDAGILLGLLICLSINYHDRACKLRAIFEN